LRITPRAMLSLLAIAACTEARLPVNPLHPEKPNLSIAADPGHYVSSYPTEYFAVLGDAVYEAPNDPSPGSPGVWLGANVTPAACFNDQTRNIVDIDHDWLDDNCELEIARAFAPQWGLSTNDACPGGEPAWAAKYWPTYAFVRVIYMPAYYQDCGSDGHSGDSEFVMVDAHFNPATGHWEFLREHLTAHLGVQWPLIDRSEVVQASGAEFPLRYLGHARVAVSIDKHANYGSDSKCNNALFGPPLTDACGDDIPPMRFPVHSSRNAGSRFLDRLGCVGSIGAFVGNGTTECFYVWKKFNGWQTTGDGASEYAKYLGAAFEYYEVVAPTATDPGQFDGGPGPAPAILVRANITGPTQISTSGTYTWTASATNCNPSCTYQWRRSTDNVTWFTIGTGTSLSLFYGANSPQSLILELTAYTNPNEANATRRIIVNRISGGTTCGTRIC